MCGQGTNPYCFQQYLGNKQAPSELQKLHQRRPQILLRMTMSMLMTILIIMKMMMVVLRMTTTIMTVIAVIMTI